LKQKSDLEAKQARLKIPPNKQGLVQVSCAKKTNKTCKFDDETGLPTHSADGEEVSKKPGKKEVGPKTAKAGGRLQKSHGLETIITVFYWHLFVRASSERFWG
jgi:hypothetical protein